MNATIEEVETRLRAAMDARMDEGIRPTSGCFISKTNGIVNGCCPMGAVILHRYGHYDSALTQAANELRIDREKALALASGFDGCLPGHHDVRFYDLGRRLRADYMEQAS